MFYLNKSKKLKKKILYFPSKKKIELVLLIHINTAVIHSKHAEPRCIDASGKEHGK